MSVSVSMKNFVIKISDVRGGGGEGGFGRHSDNPGQTGEGGSENHDFGRTSFVNAPCPFSEVFLIFSQQGSSFCKSF